MSPTAGCLACLDKISFLRPNPISYIQLLLHGLSLIFGFLICIPVGITLRRFDGNCLLFAQIIWDDYHIWPWSETSCDFILYMNLGINIIYNVLSILFILMFVMPKYRPEKVKKIDGVDRVGLLTKYQTDYVLTNTNPLMTAINILIWCFQISGAIVITVGLSQFCDSLEKSLANMGESMTCSQAEKHVDWSKYTMMLSEMDDGVEGKGFFVSLNIATICSWIQFCLWTFQLALNFGQIFNRCSCDIAEEKVKIDASQRIAARRSRMATPIGTPGGRHTPVAFGQPMAPSIARGPPSTASYMPPPGPPQHQSSVVLGAPPGWARGPQSTSSLA